MMYATIKSTYKAVVGSSFFRVTRRRGKVWSSAPIKVQFGDIGWLNLDDESAKELIGLLTKALEK